MMLQKSMQSKKNLGIAAMAVLCLGALFMQSCFLFSAAAVDRPSTEGERYDYLIVNRINDTGSAATVRANPDFIRSVTTLVIPSSVRGMTITEIEPEGFMNCSALREIVLPSTVRKIADKAFQSCTSLTRIQFSSSVTEIGQSAFYGCTSLKSVHIPASVTRIRTNAFAGCTQLSSLRFAGGAALEIGTRSFSGCAFTSITLPDRLTMLRSFAFENCRELTEVSVESPTPPAMEPAVFLGTRLSKLYVPSAAYRTAPGWSTYSKMMIIR